MMTTKKLDLNFYQIMEKKFKDSCKYHDIYTISNSVRSSPNNFWNYGYNIWDSCSISCNHFLAQTFKLINDYSRESAVKVMFSSFIYLPIVQISYVLDKI